MKNMLVTALKNQTSHGSPWLSCVHQGVRDKQWSESGDWQRLKWINTRPFSVLFFPITVIWGETHFSCIQSVWMDFFSSLALYERQQLDDLFSECSVSTGGLFQLSFARHIFCFLPERFQAPRWTLVVLLKLVWWAANSRHFSGNKTFSFHFLNLLDFSLQYMRFKTRINNCYI